MKQRVVMLAAIVLVLSLLSAASGVAAQTEITAPTIDEPTTIVHDPAEVGLEGDCGCKPWWCWVLIGVGGAVLLGAFYATYRSMRGR